MHHFATALSAVIIATVLVSGTSPTPAEAATTSSADKAALKEATAACKAEAKENKIRWPREPEMRKQLRRKDYQTHAGRTSEDCRETGDRCMQGRGERQEEQVAREPQIRQQLSLKRSQGLPS